MTPFVPFAVLRRGLPFLCACLITAAAGVNPSYARERGEPLGEKISALMLCLPASGTPNGDSIIYWAEPFVKTAADEFRQLEREFWEETESMRMRLADIRTALEDPRNRTPERGFELMWERSHLEETLNGMDADHELKKLKLRYRKSIEIVKMLYEKILSMDHHFSSLKAQQDMLNLSNPHNYPEFKEVRTAVEEKVKKKFGFQLPDLFKSNPFLSAAFTIVGMVTGSGDEKEKKGEMDKVACILDFTVRMHNDLNVIFYETGYLRDANLTLKKECEALFSECARQVGYTIPLTSCRDSDDWERLYTMLDTYVAKALGETQPGTSTTGTTGTGGYNNNSSSGGYGNNNQNQGDPRLISKATTNLQFSVDRVTQFIEKYGTFVGQGGEYYKKFSKIADSYENEKTCNEALPAQFTQLKSDIDQTLDKFNSAYRMPEVQGSKLKDMLYGTVAD